MTELQPKFQYYVKTSVKNGEIVETKQLYFDFHLWYSIHNDYWGCTKCRTYISTRGDELKNKDQPLPTHSPHTFTSPDEFKIKQHLEVIKQRVSTEIHTWPSIIYDEEIIVLQTKIGLSAEAVAFIQRDTLITRVVSMPFVQKTSLRPH